jgi:hypothetical protein
VIRLCGLFLWGLLIVLSAPVHADELRPGYLQLTQRDAAHWDMIWKAPVLAALPPGPGLCCPVSAK